MKILEYVCFRFDSNIGNTHLRMTFYPPPKKKERNGILMLYWRKYYIKRTGYNSNITVFFIPLLGLQEVI